MTAELDASMEASSRASRMVGSPTDLEATRTAPTHADDVALLGDLTVSRR